MKLWNCSSGGGARGAQRARRAGVDACGLGPARHRLTELRERREAREALDVAVKGDDDCALFKAIKRKMKVIRSLTVLIEKPAA